MNPTKPTDKVINIKDGQHRFPIDPIILWMCKILVEKSFADYLKFFSVNGSIPNKTVNVRVYDIPKIVGAVV